MVKRQIPLGVPGQILLEEFLKPRGVTNIEWRKKSASRNAALLKLSRASAPSLPILPRALEFTSAWKRSSG